MKPLSLSKSSLLRKPWEYKKVYDRGSRIRGDRLTIIFTPNSTGENRLGISVHGTKKAVTRNRIKRIIREFFRLNRDFIAPPSDIVFAVRNGFSPNSTLEIKQLVDLMLSRSNGPIGNQSPR